MKLISNRSIPVVILAIFYLVGFIGFHFDISRSLFIFLTPFTLLATFTFLILYHNQYTPGFLIASIIIIITGYFIEVVGVNTGIIFGDYVYGSTLGFKLLKTPLIIGINWLLLSYSCYLIIKPSTFPKFSKPFLAAYLMLAYDIVLEHVAIKFDMWSWESNSIPFQNYIAWFVISFIFQLVMTFFDKNFSNVMAFPLFVIQFLFFLLINISFYLF